MMLLTLLKASADSGVFLSWGIFSIQLGNLIVIIAMLVVFLLALILPFPGGRRTK
ncbi:hypothetical protein [Leifsonia sp. Root112D2]|uniref:hypothetical protein n=1 Tax=Leifsonia sp. Root112D2 TaxID=1736426 RepID=UPI000B0BCAFA|nr:hypothetical protein [Leifsonia sp. Root112D2]